MGLDVCVRGVYDEFDSWEHVGCAGLRQQFNLAIDHCSRCCVPARMLVRLADGASEFQEC